MVPDIPARTDQMAQLEQAFIAEFLRRFGLTEAQLRTLPDVERHALEIQASAYASGRLAEVEARAHYIHDLHHHE